MQILSLIRNPYVAGGAAVWLFNVMVLRMPPPDARSSKFYQWAFGVLHSISGAIPRVAANFLPPDSFLYKLLAGGNGSPTALTTSGGSAISTTKPDSGVDGAPPKG